MRLALVLLFPFFACTRTDAPTVDDTAGIDDTDAPRVDGDSDGFTEAEGDCDDANAAVNPDEFEVCDEVDNNCDLAVDEGVTVSWYPDVDGDGFGDENAVPTVSCTAPTGSVDNAGDCDDTDTGYNPLVEETDCTDPIDYNCDGAVGYADDDADTFPACEDCDDTNASVNADGIEVCNGIDDNCDKSTDGPDAEGRTLWYADDDGDGFGDAGASTETCDAPLGYVADATDCDDTDASVGAGGGAGSGSETFGYVGDVQTFEVPSCVTEVVIEVYGAEGVKATTTASTAGLGGMARGTLAVSTGDTLYVYVGGNDGYNGGGDGWSGSANLCNGGGASDVRLGGMALADRVIVAGGGGGVSGESAWGNGGAGGGGTCGANYCGGEAGVGYGFSAADGGVSGGSSGSAGHGGPGGGGGFSSGGAGATATYAGTVVAGTGALGLGGDGAGTEAGCCELYGLAGGGGGYYGGGGVAGGCCGGGGAGGGSSFTGTLTSTAFAAGVQSGDGQVVISW